MRGKLCSDNCFQEEDMSKKNKNKSKQPPAETGHDFRAEKPEEKNLLYTPLPGVPDGVSGDWR